MPNFYSIFPGQPMARIAAQHVLDTQGVEGLPRCILLLPTRRACNLMRHAFMELLEGRPVLLPRILPLGDLEAELPGLLPAADLEKLSILPPAMPEWQRMARLVQLVTAFEQRRQGDVRFAIALGLAQELARLQDHCARHAVPLTIAALRQLEIPAHYAQHWESSLAFLAIVAEHWPILEAELGMTTAAARQTALLQLLAESWQAHPSVDPVFAIGSTGSQAPTAQLLQAIAYLPNGQIILPGLPPHTGDVQPGHPLYHMRRLCEACHVASITPLGEGSTENIWLTALAGTEEVPNWHHTAIPAAQAEHIQLIPCAHGEEEARVLTLLLREAVAQGKRTALVTPDEGLMQRVGTHLKRYGLAPDRLKQGSLAETECGSLVFAMLDYIANASRTLPMLALLRHPLLQSSWADWLAQMEPHARGLARHQPGQLPPIPPELRTPKEARQAASLLRACTELTQRRLAPSGWVAALRSIAPLTQGEGADAVGEALDALAHADAMGALELDAFTALAGEALATAWRGGIHEGHPDIAMLTPVEARLEQFDRVILANMQDALWPGLARPGAWLNLAQQQALGLPSPEEEASLAAHDLLLLGSQPEVFITWPQREKGSPTIRSRYIERLAACLAVQGIAEPQLQALDYVHWARQWHDAPYAPAAPPMPRPMAGRRPQALAVTRLNRLTTDPYFIYARDVLGLRELDPIDKEADASEFGTLAHDAIAALDRHWQQHARPATPEELREIADAALAPFIANPEAALFWQHRLQRALAFVERCEPHRRDTHVQVSAEAKLQQTLPLAGTPLTLYARLDRVEEEAGGITIGDYKTGTAPSDREGMDGRAPQLLAYALMLEAQGKPVLNLEYWELPGGKREGDIRPAPLSDELLEQLRQLLADFMHPDAPLLARPLPSKNEHYSNPYDGISRYDEWAS